MPFYTKQGESYWVNDMVVDLVDICRVYGSEIHQIAKQTEHFPYARKGVIGFSLYPLGTLACYVGSDN